jgi:hypothetical protein
VDADILNIPLGVSTVYDDLNERHFCPNTKMPDPVRAHYYPDPDEPCATKGHLQFSDR